MPNPFSEPKKAAPAAKGAVQVTNSTLCCEVCFEETSEGLYYPDEKRLVFTCPRDHVNTVKGVEV